jgi:putative hydrolase of the HAD superfamily
VPPTALILDYGEVLSHSQPADTLAAMAGVLGAPEPALVEAYWRRRDDYDCGLPAREYWADIGLALGVGVPDEAQLAALIACDVASWTDYRDEMWDLAREFRSRGGRTAFLSNGVPEIMARIRVDRPLGEYFDAVVVSSEVGLAKPEPAIYHLTLGRLGARAADTLFVDDREVNTAAAEALGIATLTFSRNHSADDVRRVLGL